jgi:hypothetical protein
MIETNPRHAAADAPNQEQLDRLYAATFGQGDSREVEVENRFLVVGTSRLTMRRGEIIHFEPGWIHREAKLIRIPHQEPCNCDYCVEQAIEYAEGKDITVEEALDEYWSPKSEASARVVYYGWSEQTIATVEEYAEIVGTWDKDPSTINRRIDRLAARAQIEGNLYPHALRAAAGIFHASIGLSPYFLRTYMGWKDIDTAFAYIGLSGWQLAQRIERGISCSNLERPDAVPEEDLIPPHDGSVEMTDDPGLSTDLHNATLSDFRDAEA